MMKPNILDRAIMAMAPVHAAKRAAARAALSVINSGYGNYGANLTKKSMRGWMYHGGSAKEDIEDNIDILRQRSRDAYMGIPTATAALKTMRTNVVAGGLMPAPQLDSDYLGLDEAEIDRRVHEAADFVGLDPALLERSPFELSGGQKRRVAVAGVMAMRPRILVLDEPAAGLDPEGRDDILSEVKEYHKKTGTTVLLVSHSMEDIAKYANRVLVMSNKKIAMYDTVEKVFARAPELLGLGLSVPQVTKIFLKLREMGVDVPADVYTIPYAVKMILEAKRRRDAGESLVLPRADKQEGGADKC